VNDNINNNSSPQSTRSTRRNGLVPAAAQDSGNRFTAEGAEGAENIFDECIPAGERAPGIIVRIAPKQLQTSVLRGLRVLSGKKSVLGVLAG
jgi:hypothetical protein